LIADIFQRAEQANKYMQRYQKLTKVIAGRTIKTATTQPGGVLILFDDQSSMKIKTAAAAEVSSGAKIKSVHEAKTEFKIEFENGSTATLWLADPVRQLPSVTRIMWWNISDRASAVRFPRL
jgi:coenzyme F420-reducing hydrogenase alpha subunit